MAPEISRFSSAISVFELLFGFEIQPRKLPGVCLHVFHGAFDRPPPQIVERLSHRVAEVEHPLLDQLLDRVLQPGAVRRQFGPAARGRMDDAEQVVKAAAVSEFLSDRGGEAEYVAQVEVVRTFQEVAEVREVGRQPILPAQRTRMMFQGCGDIQPALGYASADLGNHFADGPKKP